MHRDAVDQRFVLVADHLGLDLAGGHRVDAHAELRELHRHLAGQRRQGGLGGRIGRSREGMDEMAGDRGNVDDGRTAVLRPAAQRLREAAAQHQRREEIQVEDFPPAVDRPVQAAQPLLDRRLWRHGRVVDQRMQRRAAQRLVGPGHEILERIHVGQVGRNMVGPVGIAFAGLGRVFAAAGDDPPVFRRKALYRSMADTAACAGQDHRLSLFVHGCESI